MLKAIVIVLLLIGSWASAEACDMRTEMRPATVSTYVENGWACLNRPTPGFRFDAAAEQKFIADINRERIRVGLAPLIERPEMVAAARFHSLDMGVNGFFGHNAPDGSTHTRRIAAFDRTLLPSYTAENVAKSERVCTDRTGRTVRCNRQNKRLSGTVESLHQGLMDSPPHRKNILSATATHIAVGVAYRDGGIYVTQLFAQPVGELEQPMPLRISAGHQIDLMPTVRDWTFKRFSLIQHGFKSDILDGLIPVGIVGDANLGVRCERLGEPIIEPTQIIQPYEFIYLTGPAFTISPPTETPQYPTKAF